MGKQVLNKKRQLQCDIIKTEALGETQFQVLVNMKKCGHAFALRSTSKKFICCAYSYTNNVYECRFWGEDVKMDDKKSGNDTGSGVVYCWY